MDNASPSVDDKKLDAAKARAAAIAKKAERKQRYQEARDILRNKAFKIDIAKDIGEWLELAFPAKPEALNKSGRVWLTTLAPYISKMRKGAYTFDEIADAIRHKAEEVSGKKIPLTGAALELFMDPESFKELRPKKKAKAAKAPKGEAASAPEAKAKEVQTPTPEQAQAKPEEVKPTPAPEQAQAGANSTNGVEAESPKPQPVEAQASSPSVEEPKEALKDELKEEKTEAKAVTDVKAEPPPLPVRPHNKDGSESKNAKNQQSGSTAEGATKRSGGMLGRFVGGNRG